MKSLYDINAELLAIVEQAHAVAEESGGVIPYSMDAAIDALEIERSQKIGNVARYIKNLVAEAEMIKAEELSLHSRRKSAEKKSAWLKAYLASMMPGETYKDENTAVSWRKSSSVKVTGEIPDGYCKIERKPILSDIKAALLDGIELNAVIEENVNIQIK